jgi:phosphoesterase RecJ-like protein
MKISSKLLNIIKRGRSFLIVCHINPEGDAIGSVLALAHGLRRLGKKNIYILSRDGVPDTLKFLPSSKAIKKAPPKKEFDVLCIVDCNTLERAGFKDLRARDTIIMDHHILPDNAGGSDKVSASLIDPEAAAAGMLIYKLLIALKVPIDKKIAACLYTAILVDTGGFRYSNVSPESLRIASCLVEAGARPWDIAKALYENVPDNTMELLSLSLQTLGRDGAIAWMSTTLEMFKKTGTTAEDTEDFVEFPRKIKGVEVAAFFREDSSNMIKISLRSKGRVNVEKIAKGFGGGGHAAAAGCRIKGKLKEAQEKVFTAVKRSIKQ